jgi:predicted peptidase
MCCAQTIHHSTDDNWEREMKRTSGNILWTFGVTLTLAALLSSNRAAADETAQQSCELDRTVKVTMDYLLYLPEGYDEKDSWPLLLFLHGAGERGDDLELVKKHGPPKLIAAGKQFPFIVVSPQCPKGRWWQPFELTALLDEIVEKYRVDQERICVTGLSMGGFGTWSLAAYTPERFAALAPICGGGEAYWAREFAHIPTWAFHGGKDSLVPQERSERMVEAMNKHGGSARLTVYPDAGHDSWTETYDNPELYEWLLQQKRTAREVRGN